MILNFPKEKFGFLDLLIALGLANYIFKIIPNMLPVFRNEFQFLPSWSPLSQVTV